MFVIYRIKVRMMKYLNKYADENKLPVWINNNLKPLQMILIKNNLE